MDNLRQFLHALREEGEIVDVYHPVDPTLEIAEIHRRVAAADGPALFFHNVRGSAFPLVTNLFGSMKRIDIAFGKRPERFVEQMAALAKAPPSLATLWQNRSPLKQLIRLGTKRRRKSPVKEVAMRQVDLEKLPLLKTWPLDGGHFVTLPLVYTEPPAGGPPNLGMYRIQRYSKDEAGLHLQIGKGGGFHFAQAEERGESLPVSIFIGGPPALILSAITPLPENVPELIVCSLLQGSKVATSTSPATPHPLLSECEFALLGSAPPGVRRPEGPFGDHYGYYSWTHDFPLFKCTKLYHRKGAIYPATVVGKPRQEDFYIGNYLQKLLSPIFPLVMPGVKDLWSYGETGFHSLSAAVVRERYWRECMSSAFRILGEGQLALTKFLLVTDQSIELQNFKQTLTTVLERFRPETDLFIFSNLSMDTLDYTGPELNKGSRGIMLGVGDKVRTLPESFTGALPRPLTAALPFCPGCLVLEGPSYEAWSDFSHLFENEELKKWPLLILVDDISKALRTEASFLWTVFTRFEPAADIHSATPRVHRHHLCYQPPLLIDARMKPSYPPEVLCDPDTAQLVTDHWHNYFPKGMEMGDSDSGHI